MSTVLDAFTSSGRWYRGNLHLHTTVSDGRFSPPDSVALYRENGYDFLAVTDHWKRVDPASLGGDDDFLLIPGEEINGYDPGADMIWHAVALFLPREIEREENHRPAQWAIDRIREAGADAVLAHPYWSGDQTQDILPLEGLTAIEVFNTTCERAHGRGHSLVHLDGLWHKRKRLWGTAVDDAHHGRLDGLQGWIMLRAPELSLDAVRAAFQAGRFYASTGPEIHSLRIAEGTMTVRCSPCEAVHVQSNRWIGRSAYADADFGGPGHPLTEVTLALSAEAEATYVRVTVTDHRGRSAWSNPIALK
jgi:hypothetical protein